MAICKGRNALDGLKMTCLRSDPPVGTARTEVRAPGRPCKRKSVRGCSSERAAAGAGRLAVGRSTAAELVERMFIHLETRQDLSESKICHWRRARRLACRGTDAGVLRSVARAHRELLLHQLGCPFCIANRADYSLVDTVYSHTGASALYYRAAGEIATPYRDAFDGQWPC